MGAWGRHRDQGLNRLMLAVRDMMANFHFHDLEVLPEEHPEGDGEWDWTSSEAHAQRCTVGSGFCSGRIGQVATCSALL